jgi:hypothetical protein
MNFKDLFIEKKEEDVPVKKVENTFPNSGSSNFPSSNDTVFPKSNETMFPPVTNVTPHKTNEPNPYIDKILEVYENGFVKLNKPGYDFFEFFKSVTKAGIDNPQVYVMALDMGQAMDSNVSKDSLSNQADFYVTEIVKVHTNFNNEGQSKINDLTNRKNSETQSLTSEITSLKLQLESIQNQIANKQGSLNAIDQKYQPEINEVSLKLAANDMAKEKFVSTINRVKTNISNNLK